MLSSKALGLNTQPHSNSTREEAQDRQCDLAEILLSHEDAELPLLPISSPPTHQFPSQESLEISKDNIPSESLEKLGELLLKHVDSACPEKLISLLLSHRPDTSFRDETGKTALHIAAQSGNLKICETLIDYSHFPTLDLQDDLQRTPLHYAAISNHNKVVRLLVRSGASLNLQDVHGNSPLHHIAGNRNIDLFQFLLRRDANLRLVNSEGQTPIEKAKASQISDEVCLLNITPSPYKIPSKILEDEDDNSNNDNNLNFEEKSEVEDSIYDFEMVKVLKKIKYGEIVYAVRHSKSGEMFNMKVMKKSKLQGRELYMKYAVTERTVLLAVSSPFISSLKYSYQSDSYLYMVLDYCPGDLSKLMKLEKCLEEERARLYLAESILAIEELHKLGIVYRNLRPENVAIDEDGHIKLTNLGYSKEGIGGIRRANSFFMEIDGFPPEVIQSEGHGKPVDWYMAGALLYHMLTGKKPFYHRDSNVMIQKIKEGNIDLPSCVSPSAKDLVHSLMHTDPNERLGSKDGAAEIKQHCFFKDFDWGRVERGQVLAPAIDFRDCNLMASYSDEMFRSSCFSADLSHIQDWDYNYLG